MKPIKKKFFKSCVYFPPPLAADGGARDRQRGDPQAGAQRRRRLRDRQRKIPGEDNTLIDEAIKKKERKKERRRAYSPCFPTKKINSFFNRQIFEQVIPTSVCFDALMCGLKKKSRFFSLCVLSQAALDDVESRRQEVLAEVRRRRDEKKKVLEEQMQIIQQERTKVDQDVKVREKKKPPLDPTGLLAIFPEPESDRS